MNLAGCQVVGYEPRMERVISFLCMFGQWVRFDGTEIGAVNQAEAVEENFPLQLDSERTASI
jgi:hypothetical protein